MTLKIVTQFVSLVLHLVMRHHHTKFGHKRWSSSENILWIKLNRPTEGQTEAAQTDRRTARSCTDRQDRQKLYRPTGQTEAVQTDRRTDRSCTD